MNSRERVKITLEHREPDRIPLDIGATPVSGMHVQSVYRLRQALKLDPPGTPVKIIEPYQNLGEIQPDLMDKLGIDVVGISPPGTLFGFKNQDWKPWTAFDGTPVLVPGNYNTTPEPNGDILMYPDGDKSVSACARMPEGGWYFDATMRQPPIDENQFDVEDNLEEFEPISDADIDYFKNEADRLYNETDKAIIANFGGTAFGDIALVPATWLKNPKGIRDVSEWYISTVIRSDYIRQIFERQCEIALDNLARLYTAIGDHIVAVYMTGADFGTQQGPFISPETYRTLYQPFHKRLNEWIHTHTPWKTFMHSCGSVAALIPDFIAAGFDILNPVQCTAANMDPKMLKKQFGDRLTFWGGGVDTQDVLPFGTPDDVRRQVLDRIKDFGPGGGFVFNTIHNIQPRVPVENLLALFESLNENRGYPI
jgi:hypothetical protein